MTRQAGFSLVEVLAAVMVFAVVSAISVGLLGQALRARSQTEAALLELGEVQRIQALLRDDIGQLVMRTVRTGEGLEDPRAFAGGALGVDLMGAGPDGAPREVLVLTRTGWANPGAAQPRSTLQRVAWLYDGDRLWREAWPYPDAARETQPNRQLIAEGLEELRLDFLAGRSWVDTVRLSASEDAAPTPPRAVRLRYTLLGSGAMEHVALSPAAELGR